MIVTTPPPAAPLTVNVSWSQTENVLTGTRPSEVTIPTSGTAAISAPTKEDTSPGVGEGTVTLTVESGDDYTVATPSSATVDVTDDDLG